MRGDRAAARDPAERLRRHADRMIERAAQLKKLADATQPLYQSLDDGQKHRFMLLSRSLSPNGGRFAQGRQPNGPEGRRGFDAPR